MIIVSLLAYAIIVDYGVNAGRIHYGISIGGFDVGGMTQPDAVDFLTARALGLREKRLTFHREGVVFHLEPKQIGWRPHPDASAILALAYGRSGGPLQSFTDRLRAWTGLKLSWAGKPRSASVTKVIAQWSARAARKGLTIDRDRLRFTIRRAVRRLAKDRYRIPLVSDSG